MSGAMLAAISGWILAVGLVTVIGWPYVLGRSFRAAGTLQVRMQPHYVLGYGLAPFAFVHAMPGMTPAAMADPLGLYLATGATLLAMVQIGVGLVLRDAHREARRAIRRCHLAVASAIVLAAGAHIVRDSVVLRMLWG